MCGAPAGGDLRAQPLQLALPARDKEHACSPLGGGDRGSPADPGGGAGDQDSLAREGNSPDYPRDAPILVLSGATGEETLPRRVRRAIEKGLREHESPSAERLAAQLAMSTPTLRRRLRDEGTSLREVRDEVLCRLAIAGIERDREPIAAVSERLGFSEPSAFTRTFRRWTGRSPSSYRRGVLGRHPSATGADR